MSIMVIILLTGVDMLINLELAFESITDLKKGLKLLETFRLFNLQINASKTKTMILNFKCFMDQLCTEQSYPESIVKLNDQVIENV